MVSSPDKDMDFIVEAVNFFGGNPNEVIREKQSEGYFPVSVGFGGNSNNIFYAILFARYKVIQ